VSDTEPLGFSWGFIDEITWWALGISASIAAVVAIPTGDTAFALGCLVGTTIDVVLVRVASGRARTGLAQGRIDRGAALIMVPVRLAAKAGLLLASLAAPAVIGFAGTVIGVLAFDVTLALVGSIKAATRTMRHPKEGG